MKKRFKKTEKYYHTKINPLYEQNMNPDIRRKNSLGDLEYITKGTLKKIGHIEQIYDELEYLQSDKSENLYKNENNLPFVITSHLKPTITKLYFIFNLLEKIIV